MARKCHVCGSQLSDSQPARKPWLWGTSLIGHCGMLWLLPQLRADIPHFETITTVLWCVEMVSIPLTLLAFGVSVATTMRTSWDAEHLPAATSRHRHA